MLVSLMPVGARAYAQNSSSEESGIVWEHSKSKTATNLDADLTSDVTLTLPSADEQSGVEVCFVLDKSQFSDTKTSALKLLSELKDAVDASGASAKVDIIGFNRAGFEVGSYDLSTQYDEIVAAFNADAHGGTNMHAGLLLAQEVLARDTSIPDDRKYMILVSDGDTYLYCPDGDYTTHYSRAYRSVEDTKTGMAGGYYDEVIYRPSAPMDGNVGRPTTSDQASWDAYLADVAARNAESNGDSYDFSWNYYDGWQSMTYDEITADGFVTQPKVPRSASNIDMAFLYAANTYHELAAQYHCYAMAVPSWNTADGGHSAFMDYLNNGAATDFESIANQILYLVGAGSSVDDYMGYTSDYNFDLSDSASMYVTVEDSDGNTQTYSAQLIEENHYGFGPILDDGSYSYEVEYISGDMQAGEHLIWTTNVNISNFEHVSLTYTVQLVNPQEESGTFGTYDADGSLDADGLYTNNSATLYPIDSDGVAQSSEEFAKPTVSYTRYTVVYTDGADGEEVFADQSTVVTSGASTPVFDGTPTREGYTFAGWSPEVADTVTGDVTYTAVWEPVASTQESTDEQNEPTAPSADAAADATPATGDSVDIMPFMAIAAAAALCLTGALAYRRSEK